MAVLEIDSVFGLSKTKNPLFKFLAPLSGIEMKFKDQYSCQKGNYLFEHFSFIFYQKFSKIVLTVVAYSVIDLFIELII